ncbi:MAG: hypothetical protein DYG89_27695 [Caldilinea sp. CFX5]|nr:hypothetical protein [Caldilinea sp. CFX5]
MSDHVNEGVIDCATTNLAPPTAGHGFSAANPALALGACATEEGGISDREGAALAENAGQGPESEEGVGELEN